MRCSSVLIHTRPQVLGVPSQVIRDVRPEVIFVFDGELSRQLRSFCSFASVELGVNIIPSGGNGSQVVGFIHGDAWKK